MATQVLPALLPESATSDQAAPAPSPRRSLAHRLFDAFTQAQMRRAHREIARVMNAKGLRFTEGYQPRK
jgi:hypothetical protein